MMDSPSIRPSAVQAARLRTPADARRELMELLQERPIRLNDALQLVEAGAPPPGEPMSTAFSPIVIEVMQANATRFNEETVAVAGRAIVERIFRVALQRDAVVFAIESPAPEQEESWGRNGKWDDSCSVETASAKRTNLLTEVLGYGESGEAWLDLIDQVYRPQPAVLQDAIKEAREQAGSIWWATYNHSLVRGFRVLWRGWIQPSDHGLTLDTPVHAEAIRMWGYTEEETIATIPLLEALARASDSAKGLLIAKQVAAAGVDLDREVDVLDGDHSNDLRIGARATGAWRGTLLHRAISHGNSELVADLLARGCDPRKESTVRPSSAPDRIISLGDAFDALADRSAAVTEQPHVRNCAEIQSLLQNWQAHNRARSVLAQIEVEHGDQASPAASARGMRLP